MANYEVSQSMELLTPRKSQAYPIQKEEWNYIKEHINSCKCVFAIYNSIGFLLLGGGASGILSIISNPSCALYWIITVCCFICGLLCLHFSKLSNQTKNENIDNIIEYMEIIEERYVESDPKENTNRDAPNGESSTMESASYRSIVKETIKANPESTAADIAAISQLPKQTVAGYVSALYLAKEICVVGEGHPKKFKLTKE
ncbi:putative membrane protein [Ereboglobus sp. PH5-10]|uniref:hypothetical protein n=1 Tax=Ereboglobus sp. PH5-10 TaxID=2940629 RepID=UPI002404F400|nr:hypothetical protein [Ereboglobus sp. PH5-10]MDF9826221.1 putative membrane protein [Ereboglobus sp. PH5-10]